MLTLDRPLTSGQSRMRPVTKKLPEGPSAAFKDKYHSSEWVASPYQLPEGGTIPALRVFDPLIGFVELSPKIVTIFPKGYFKPIRTSNDWAGQVTKVLIF